MNRFRDGLVFKAHRLLYHSTLGTRVIKKKKKKKKKLVTLPLPVILIVVPILRLSGTSSHCKFFSPEFRNQSNYEIP